MMNTGQRLGLVLLVKQAIALVSIVIAFGHGWTVAAQQGTGCEVTALTLKQQLFDLESKETRLRMRLEELDEQLKPESIERELAGIGSTHPEELREHRRKLLTIERNGLQTQLDLLEEDRTLIEAAIPTAGACRLFKSEKGKCETIVEYDQDSLPDERDPRVPGKEPLAGCRARSLRSADWC